MSEPKWTPGPWTFEDETGCIWADPTTQITDLDCSSSVDDDERDANSRLIAAAPDLYATLEKVLPILVARGKAGVPDSILAEVRDVMAKARTG